jgi:hypothetical protein
MLVQIYSDLHLEELEEFPRFPVLSNVLILAGDIGHINSSLYADFLDYCSDKWKEVWVVLGNHELYSLEKSRHTLELEYIDFFNRYDNIYLIHRNTHTYYDKYTDTTYKIIGCPLWCNVPEKYEDKVNSLKYIRGEKGPITLDEFNQLHREELAWALHQLENSHNPVLVTHFPFTIKNTRQARFIKDDPSDMIYAFANNYNSLLKIKYSKQLTCISGHTHYSHDFKDNNVRFISNQLGYKYEDGYTSFKNDGMFRL